MAFDLDELVRCLTEGDNLDIGYHRIFGGQILGQIVVVAAAASPEKSIKSVHVLFPREGDAAQPMAYRVEALQAGRTFASTQVIAHQGDRVVAAALVSLHVDEDGLDRSDPPPLVGPPEAATLVDLGMVPWETRVADGVDLADRSVGPPRLEWWMRTPSLAPAAGGPAGDRALHQALLAHATDLTVIGTALRPFEGVSQADSTVGLQTAVTAHTLWFHRPFRVDDWLLIAQHSPVVAGARAYGRGDVWSNGDLVASFAQESLLRPVSN